MIPITALLKRRRITVRVDVPMCVMLDHAAMSHAPQRIEVTLETLFDSVNLAEKFCLRIAESSGFSEDDCYKIAMAVHEAVINALRYGNEEQRHKKITVIVEVDLEKFVIHIVDQGRGFSLADIPNPLTEENLLKTSGRGIFIMRAFMDEFDVRRSSEGGAEIVMAKRLPSSSKQPSTRRSI
jgi:serine/threonine-protein kinase RsbW